MTWVKVCGLTRSEDVVHAVSAGADAVGFVSWAASPRYVALESVADLAAGVEATTVLLTVDLDADAALAAVEACGVTGIQPYGVGASEVVAAALAAGLFVLQPMRAGSGARPQPPAIPLLDTPDEVLLGGTGRTFDWALAEGVTGDFVLAGGLGPDNVAEAMHTVRPWGVDASSRLEAAPGIKDPGKVADFVRKAKES